MLPREYPQCWIMKNTVLSLVLAQGDLDSSDLVVSACLCVSPVLLPGSGQGMVLYVDMECSQIGVNVLEPCFAIIITRKWRICECVANWSQRCLSVGNKHTNYRLVSVISPISLLPRGRSRPFSGDMVKDTWEKRSLRFAVRTRLLTWLSLWLRGFICLGIIGQ